MQEVWSGQYALRDNRGGHYTNTVKTEKLTEDLFLEFGRRKENNNVIYQWVSVLKGNYRRPKGAHQLFFTHKLGEKGTWWVYDDTCIQLVEKGYTKEEAITRLRELAKKYPEGWEED